MNGMTLLSEGTESRAQTLLGAALGFGAAFREGQLEASPLESDMKLRVGPPHCVQPGAV